MTPSNQNNSADGKDKGHSLFTYFIFIMILNGALPDDIFWYAFAGLGIYFYFSEIQPQINRTREEASNKRYIDLEDEEPLPHQKFGDELELTDIDKELEDIIAEKHKNHKYDW